MKGITIRLILGHILVAVVAAVATLVVVRGLAPALFNEELRLAILAERGASGASGRVPNVGLRGEFAKAVEQALIAGGTFGVLVATAVGIFVALRLGGSLGRLGEATRRIASGDYGVRVPVPAETELAAISADVNTLGSALAETETRRLRLLGEVAHEMRTPLTVIDGYVEGMIDGVLPADVATLSLLSGETRRLRRLSDDLTALSRAQEGRLELTPQPVDLREVVRDAAERLRPQTEDAGIDLRIEPGEQPLTVMADADRIAQVVTNLVGNAIRATPPGGHVTLRTGTAEGQARLEVTDSGEGLEAGHLERVFERFYRVPGRRHAESPSGSGVGLTIAREIARGHRGDLVAHSAGPGRGATFTVTLPLA